jgi:hypothetical protein
VWWVTSDGAEVRAKEWDIQVRDGEVVTLGLRSAEFHADERASTEMLRLRADFTAEPFKGEPDNTPDEAQALEIGREASFVFLARHDRDYFRLTAPGDGVLTMTLLEKPAVHEPYVWWVTSDGAEVRAKERDIQVRDGEVVTLGLRSAEFYVDERASAEPLRLRADFTAEPFSGEPDNTPDEAQALEIGQQASFVFLARHDRDYFRLTAPGDGVLTMTLLEKPAVHEPYFWWVTSDGAEVRAKEWDIQVRDGEVVTLGLRSAEFYVDERASAEPLRLRADFMGALDGQEPNDSLAEATPLLLGTEIELNFVPRRDTDIFVLELEDQTLARLELLRVPEGLEPDIYWLDARGEELGPARRELWNQGSSRVYLRFRSARYSWDERVSVVPLRFRVTLVRTADGFEPNDRSNEAAAIAVGRRLRAELTEGDIDLFSIAAEELGTYRAVVDADSALRLEWRDTDGSVLTEDRDVLLAGGQRAVLAITASETSENRADGPLGYAVRVVLVGGDPFRDPGSYPRSPPSLSFPKPRTVPGSQPGDGDPGRLEVRR